MRDTYAETHVEIIIIINHPTDVLSALLTAHRGGVDIESRFLKPRRDGDVFADEARHVAAHKHIIAEEAAGTLHFRIVTLVHHCNTRE